MSKGKYKRKRDRSHQQAHQALQQEPAIERENATKESEDPARHETANTVNDSPTRWERARKWVKTTSLSPIGVWPLLLWSLLLPQSINSRLCEVNLTRCADNSRRCGSRLC